MTPRLAFTIGYEGAAEDKLLALLTQCGVDTVIDTRLNPQSRRPAFRQRALREALASVGIGYVSMPALGVPKQDRARAKDDWPGFVDYYQRHLDGEATAVSAAIAICCESTTALLCFELDEGQCHRLPLSRAMSTQAPLAFDHLRVGRIEDTDDHPVLPAVMRPEYQMDVAAR
jgi:hypothetical protein